MVPAFSLRRQTPCDRMHTNPVFKMIYLDKVFFHLFIIQTTIRPPMFRTQFQGEGLGNVKDS